jgi:hypothetical protein
MKKLCLLLLLALPVLLPAQSLSTLSAAWIEMEKLSNQSVEVRLYTAFPDLNETLPDSVNLQAYTWQASSQAWIALTNQSSISISLHQQFQVEQNTYYPNCAPWIGAQACIPMVIGLYKGTFHLPATTDSAQVRLVYKRTGVSGVNNAFSGSEGLTALCYTDYLYNRFSSNNMHSPKHVPTETWHRYFPVNWPVRQAGDNFINSYIPFTYTTISLRGVASAPLFTAFTPATNELFIAPAFQARDSAISIFARQANPLQIGITNFSRADGRFAYPLRIWNKISALDSNLTYVFLVGNLSGGLASSVAENASFDKLEKVVLHDVLGRQVYEGPSLADFQPKQNELYVLTEYYQGGAVRHRKVKIER